MSDSVMTFDSEGGVGLGTVIDGSDQVLGMPGTICPSTQLTVRRGGAMATLWIEDGELQFDGDMSEAARLFFEVHLKPLCDRYLKEKMESKE